MRAPGEGIGWWVAALIAAGVGVYPLMVATPLFLGMPTRWFTVPARAVVVALAIWIIVRSRRGMEWNAGLSCLATFGALYVIRLACDTVQQPTDLSLPWFEYWAYFLGVCLMPGVAAWRADWRPGTSYRFVPLTILVAVAIGSGVLTLMYREILTWGVGRLGAIPADILTDFDVINPLTVAYLAALQIALAFLVAMYYRGRGRWWLTTVLCAGAGLAAIIPFAMGASRGPAVFLVIALAGLVVFRGRGALGATVVLAFVLAILFGALEFMGETYGLGGVDRIASVRQDWEDRTAAMERLFLWDRAWRAFLADPLTGHSLETPGYGTYPHNAVIEAFMTTGLVGGIAFAGGVAYCVLRSVQMIRRQPEWAWVSLLCWWGVIQATFSGALYNSGALWLGLMLVVGAPSPRRPRPRTTDHAAAGPAPRNLTTRPPTAAPEPLPAAPRH